MNQNKKKNTTEKLKAQAIKVVDMIGYQEGSVVSREIISKKTGTVTLFAFDEGQGLSEHTAPFDALVYCLDGEVEVTISGNPILVTEGEMVIMPAHQPHALKALHRFKMLLIMIRT
ncbi:MAG: cupin domain-containing protein [Candidatus Aminicenantes bacterium]|nr:MAG: cupin domain-containing protein [Candidatus Aminicenantes bacterium]